MYDGTLPTAGWSAPLKLRGIGKREGSIVLALPTEPIGSGSTPCSVEVSPSCPMAGGTHTNFKRAHAEQGHVFVVAASHLILRLRQPLQARMTEYLLADVMRWPGKFTYPSVVCVGCVHQRTHNLCSEVISTRLASANLNDRQVSYGAAPYFYVPPSAGPTAAQMNSSAFSEEDGTGKMRRTTAVLY